MAARLSLRLSGSLTGSALTWAQTRGDQTCLLRAWPPGGRRRSGGLSMAAGRIAASRHDRRRHRRPRWQRPRLSGRCVGAAGDGSSSLDARTRGTRSWCAERPAAGTVSLAGGDDRRSGGGIRDRVGLAERGSARTAQGEAASALRADRAGSRRRRLRTVSARRGERARKLARPAGARTACGGACDQLRRRRPRSARRRRGLSRRVGARRRCGRYMVRPRAPASARD